MTEEAKYAGFEDYLGNIGARGLLSPADFEARLARVKQEPLWQMEAKRKHIGMKPSELIFPEAVALATHQHRKGGLYRFVGYSSPHTDLVELDKVGRVAVVEHLFPFPRSLRHMDTDEWDSVEVDPTSGEPRYRSIEKTLEQLFGVNDGEELEEETLQAYYGPVAARFFPNGSQGRLGEYWREARLDRTFANRTVAAREIDEYFIQPYAVGPDRGRVALYAALKP